MFEYLFQNLNITAIKTITYTEGFEPTYLIQFENLTNPNVLNIEINVTKEVLIQHKLTPD